MAGHEVEVAVGNRSVRVTNPGRVYFPARGETKLDLVRYYLHQGIDDFAYSLDTLLEWAERDRLD